MAADLFAGARKRGHRLPAVPLQHIILYRKSTAPRNAPQGDLTGPGATHALGITERMLSYKMKAYGLAA